MDDILHAKCRMRLFFKFKSMADGRSSKEGIIISTDSFQRAGDDWKKIQRLARRVPKETSEACAAAIRETLMESDERDRTGMNLLH